MAVTTQPTAATTADADSGAGAGAGSGPGTGSAPATAPRMSEAMRGATTLALAGLFANVANLGVTLIIARQLSTRSYGAVAQLIAIFFVVSMPGSALQVGVVRRVTNWVHTDRADRVDAWVGRIRRVGVSVVVLITVVALLARGFVADELSLPGPGGVAEIVAAGAAWGLLCVDRGLLQCGRLYGGLAANLLIDGATKSLFTVGLVTAGMGEAGAATAVLLGVLASIAHARWTLYRHRATIWTVEAVTDDLTVAAAPTTQAAASTAAPSAAPSAASAAAATAAVGQPAGQDSVPLPVAPAPVRPKPVPVEPRRLYVEVAAALVALAFLGLLQNIDVLVQGRLEPDQSGAYASVSVTCKVLVFGALVLAVGFLLPEAADRRQLGQHALKQLGATLAVLGAPAVALAAIALVAPKKLLSLAFGPDYTGASGALLPLAGAMTCLGATVLFTHYLLALGHRSVLAALGLTAAAAVPLVLWADGDPVATAQADLVFQAALAVVTGLMVLAAAHRTAHPARHAAPHRVPRLRTADGRAAGATGAGIGGTA